MGEDKFRARREKEFQADLVYNTKLYDLDHALSKEDRGTLEDFYKKAAKYSAVQVVAIATIPCLYVSHERLSRIFKSKPPSKLATFGIQILIGVTTQFLVRPFTNAITIKYLKPEFNEKGNRNCVSIVNYIRDNDALKWYLYYLDTKESPEKLLLNPRTFSKEDITKIRKRFYELD